MAANGEFHYPLVAPLGKSMQTIVCDKQAFAWSRFGQGDLILSESKAPATQPNRAGYGWRLT
jgi:hypothetical protein